MKKLSLFTYIALLSLAHPIHAQDESTVDKAEKQIPTTKAGVENAVETANKAVDPVRKNTDPKLKLMRERALAMIERNAKYHKDVVSGKLIPLAQLRRQYTEKFPQQLASIKSQYNAIFEENYPPAKKRLIGLFQKALQPVGPYLQASDYANADMTLTKRQHTELVLLQKLDPPTQVGQKGAPMMLSQSDHLTYTMLHIPVEMKVKAQPNAVVYFSTDGGGQFENGLPMQQVKADAQGVATASWVSHGESVGVSGVTVTSPTSGSPVFFRIEVVGLSLKALPQMPKVTEAPKLKNQKETPEELKKRIESLKKQHSDKTKSSSTQP